MLSRRRILIGKLILILLIICMPIGLLFVDIYLIWIAYHFYLGSSSPGSLMALAGSILLFIFVMGLLINVIRERKRLFFIPKK